MAVALDLINDNTIGCQYRAYSQQRKTLQATISSLTSTRRETTEDITKASRPLSLLDKQHGRKAYSIY